MGREVDGSPALRLSEWPTVFAGPRAVSAECLAAGRHERSVASGVLMLAAYRLNRGRPIRLNAFTPEAIQQPTSRSDHEKAQTPGRSP
jgi:hypothetical protein